MSESRAPRTRKQRKLLRLFEEQGGACWICGLPMTAPIFDRPAHKSPSALEATVDHLAPRGVEGVNSPKRPTKAAHLKCNTVRHHHSIDHPIVANHIRAMRAKKELTP